MPGKKRAGEEEKSAAPVFGRPGNNVKMGIVGLPNVGKSTFFNLLSKLNVPAENFPFCTIDPNVCRVPVPDKRFDQLVSTFEPKSVVPAVLTVTDIAGLVRGASEGAGLGNAFLSHISAVDGIFHMVRAFPSKKVTHVEDSVDPVRDMQIIHEELRLKDLQHVKGTADTMQKNVERGVGGKEKKEEYETLRKVQEWLESGKDVRAGSWNNKEIDVLNAHLLLTAKPMIYLVNLSEKGYVNKSSAWLPKIKEYIDSRGAGETMIPLSCAFEAKVNEMEPEAAEKYMAESDARTMLPRIIQSGYRMLHLLHFFTVGKDEVRAWTVRKGSLAPQAAGTIHTDFEKGFIKAEAYHFRDFKEHGSEAAVRAAGRLRMEGQRYEVQDGDILHFKFNVTKGK
eukprot:CAMPEP_0196780648 /NCGR_PEP_ID=MMETSP1104-20130614/8287_1 /TAXON_ID=33652 /ORGANISM="Cafeteria sp., Strain Caron Lab Isolate" /LENGTH=394 /DNA_ID=CAMNT_0042150861 /DNA_START=39 /DNA_END=1223 /DNA_ORIENTATION=-